MAPQGRIRVIAGIARGTHLKEVPGESTRPIMDRVKESLFNIIGADIQGSRIWDMFGGTGSVAIEGLSRGAEYAWITDDHPSAVQTIKANLHHSRFESSAKVTRSDVFQLIPLPPDDIFDYIYIAPPQYQGLWWKTLTALDANPGWIQPDGWIIIQIDPKEREQVQTVHYEIVDERKYGNTLLLFFRKKPTVG